MSHKKCSAKCCISITSVFFCCLLWNSISLADNLEDARELFHKSLQGRNRIQSGQMFLVSTYNGQGSGQSRPSSYSMEITFTQDRFFIKKTDGNRLNYYCSNCEIPDSFIFLNLQPVLHADPNRAFSDNRVDLLQQEDKFANALMFCQDNDAVLKQRKNSVTVHE